MWIARLVYMGWSSVPEPLVWDTCRYSRWYLYVSSCIESLMQTDMHDLYLRTDNFLHALTPRYRQIKQVVSVCICMYWSIDTYRHTMFVSKYRHVVFMRYPDTEYYRQTLSCQYLCEILTRSVLSGGTCLYLRSEFQIQTDMHLLVCWCFRYPSTSVQVLPGAYSAGCTLCTIVSARMGPPM